MSRLATIQEEIVRAADSVGRDPATVTLVAVSKGHPAEEIQRLYDAGVRDFGESRLQDAQPKIEMLPRDIRWHFIGTSQSKKMKMIGSLFSLVHTLESESQILALGKVGRTVDVLIEINIANEEQKAGVLPGGIDEVVISALHCNHVRLCGFMTIGAANADGEEKRAEFRALREIGERYGTDVLSMGMSADFAVAIQEGATHIRVGTALFGERALR